MRDGWLPRLTLFMGFSRNQRASTEYKAIRDGDGWALLDAEDSGGQQMIGVASQFDEDVANLPAKRKRRSTSQQGQAASTRSSSKAPSSAHAHVATEI